MTVEIISWSFSTKVWDRAGIELIKIVWGKYPIELKVYLDLCTVRENSMGKIKTWKIDVWFIENKNINIFREHTKLWYFIVW